MYNIGVLIKINFFLFFMITYKNIFLAIASLFVFQITASYSQAKQFKVTLDAGHGDQDFGAVYYPHVEKK